MGLYLAAPAVLVVAAVYVIPAVATLTFSVIRLNVAPLRIERFVGPRHYVNAITSEAFWSVTLRTLYFGVMTVVFTLTVSFRIALLLNRSFRGRTFVLVTVLLPWAVPPVVSGVLWVQMFHAEFGFINGLVRAFGGSGDILWLGRPLLALHAVLVAETWRWIPFATLFLLAGLKTIPVTLREAAAIDGASPWATFRHVTLPLLLPVVVPVVIFLFVWSMKVFDTIFVLTRGGPSGNTTTLNYRVFQQAFEQFSFGSASATAYLLSLLTIVTIAGLSVMRRRAAQVAGRVLR